MEIHNYITLFKRWLWLIILGGLIAASAAYFVSKGQEPLYRTSAILLISEGSALNPGSEFQAFQLSERLAQSYIERLTNYEVLTQSIQNLGLNIDPDDLHNAVQVRLINNSQLIELSVTDANPQVAAALANEIPTVFAERNMTMQLARFADSKANLEAELAQVKDELLAAETALAAAKANGSEQTQLNDNLLRLRETHSRLLQTYEDIRVAEAGNLNTIIIDEYARAPQQPISPRTLTNTLLAGVVGLMLAVGVVFLIEYLDDTIKDPDTLAQAVSLNAIGLIARDKESEKLVMLAHPRSPNAEAYRQLRTNIQYVSVSRDLKTILVTSANAGEGKSTSAANLAIALAQAGAKVILVDTDMRRPSLHKQCHVTTEVGITNLLLSKENDASFIQETAVPNLQVITAGPLPPNPAELIASERMKQILSWLHERADYVILDSPPILAVTDGILLSQLASTTLLVVEAGKTRQQSLLLALQQLEAVDAHIAGILINKLNPRRSGYYNYYYQSNNNYHETGSPPRGKSLKANLTAFLPFLSS
jgi:capsular exopolysaccharide synthesis family protein